MKLQNSGDVITTLKFNNDLGDTANHNDTSLQNLCAYMEKPSRL